jgi:hypothetical protein
MRNKAAEAVIKSSLRPFSMYLEKKYNAGIIKIKANSCELVAACRIHPSGK